MAVFAECYNLCVLFRNKKKERIHLGAWWWMKKRMFKERVKPKGKG